MGRRRIRDLDLPPRLYRRGSNYYYVSADGKWHSLGTDKARALRLWAELECAGTGITVADVVQAYMDNTGKIAASTRSKYLRYQRTIEGKFGAWAADDLTVPALAKWRDSGEVKPVWFNGCIAVLRNAYGQAIEHGTATVNAPREISLNPTSPRTRYITHSEFRAVYKEAANWLKLAMDIAYLTSLRESDVLALRWNQVSDHIYVEQIKTGNRQAFNISPALRSVLEAAKRRPIVGLFVVATDKGRPIKAKRLQKAWAEACARAGVADARFHDIRGKAATDAADEGMDYQAMTGHATKAMADRYVKTRRTVSAPTHKRRV